MAGKGTRYQIRNVTRSALLADRSNRANNPVTRGFGLMGRKSLPEGGGLILQPCNSVVSFFMRFPIDVLFVDEDGVILHIIPAMIPWRASKFVRGSRFVVELPAGTARQTGTEVGDTIEIVPA